MSPRQWKAAVNKSCSPHGGAPTRCALEVPKCSAMVTNPFFLTAKFILFAANTR